MFIYSFSLAAGRRVRNIGAPRTYHSLSVVMCIQSHTLCFVTQITFLGAEILQYSRVVFAFSEHYDQLHHFPRTFATIIDVPGKTADPSKSPILFVIYRSSQRENRILAANPDQV